MSPLAATGALAIGDHHLEYRTAGRLAAGAPMLVLLHEGLGSAGLWGTFPEELAAATGLGVLAYSRAGYGRSSPVPLPRPISYMHDEALVVLPALLDRVGFERGLLVGSSDGASIAAIHAGRIKDPRVAGIGLIAPHFFVEDETVAGAAAAKLAYETGDLRAKLARWHDDVDVAFYGWNQAWVNPAFRAWDITDALCEIEVPMLIIQGERDDYGTARQIEAARRLSRGPVEAHLMPGVGHAPPREAPAQTVALIAAFAQCCLDR